VSTAVALLVLVVATGIADAKSNSPATAKAVADGFINSLLPSAPGQSGICDTKTQSGFFAKNAAYLASCTTTDGSFQAFSIADAKNDKAGLRANSPYLNTQLGTICATGHAYSTGVKQKFANIYAGSNADSAKVANDLTNLLGSQIKKAKGYIAPFKVC
jgi:hypothetical protein